MPLDKTFAVGEVLSAANVNEYLTGFWAPIDKRVISSGSPVSSSTFSGLNSNFRLFRITMHLAVSSGLWLRINNDSGSNYALQTLQGFASSVGANRLTSAIAMEMQFNGPGAPVLAELIIAKATSTFAARFLGESAGGTIIDPVVTRISGLWSNTSSLINRIDVIGNGGTFSGVVALEGMRGN